MSWKRLLLLGSHLVKKQAKGMTSKCYYLEAVNIQRGGFPDTAVAAQRAQVAVKARVSVRQLPARSPAQTKNLNQCSSAKVCPWLNTK